MDRDTYLILRVTGDDRDVADALSTPTRRSESPLESTRNIEYRVDAEKLDPQDFQQLRRDRHVAAIARPMPLRLIQPVAAAGPAAEPAPIHDATWGVFVTGALQSPYVGHGVTVAILDTGIKADHEAFRGIELIQEDFTGEGNGDKHGHGTHVAGTIFGQTLHGVRYAVAPGVRRALIGKVLGQERSATTRELVDAVLWAVKEGAQIINMSLGIDFPGRVRWWVEEEKLETDLATSRTLAEYRDNVRLLDNLVNLLRAGSAQYPSALIVAAAGNESKRNVRPDYVIEVSPPAAANGIVAVAAVQTVGEPHSVLTVAPFSNIRPAVSGPGVGIYSTWNDGRYAFLDGTSMASPHVAGVAALWADRQLRRHGLVNPGLLEAQLRGQSRQDRLPSASYLDVGEGLATAPLD